MMDEGGWDDDLGLDDSMSDDESSETNIQLGQGLLFGGLSRLIEAVTHPDEQDSLGLEDDDGWEDEDDLDALVDEQEEEEEVIQTAPTQPMLLPLSAPPVETMQASDGGWDMDDDDLEGLEDAHEESQIENSGWDDTLEGLDDTVPEPNVPQESNGWGDSLEGLDASLESPAAPAAAPTPDAAPVVEQASDPTLQESNGWDDVLEELDDLESPSAVPPAPTPPAAAPVVEQASDPTLQESNGWGDSLEGLDASLESPSAVPPVSAPVVVEQASEPTLQESNGWDDALEELDDLESPSAVPPAPAAAPVVVEQASEPTRQESNGWDDSLEGLDASLESPSAVPPAPQPAAAAPVASEPTLQESHGWDDALEELDLESPLPAPTPASAAPVASEPTLQESNGRDDALEELDDSLNVSPTPAVPTPAAAAPVVEQEAGGWDHDSLEGLDDDEEPAALQTTRIQPAQVKGDGWQEDDLDINVDDDSQKVVVDHVPPTPTMRIPNIATESMITNGDESTVVRENALDDQEFDPTDDYGPVVDHLPSEHAAQNVDATAKTNSTVVPESCVEEEEEMALKPESNNDVIDHVPEDVSNVPSASNFDSTASVDGDEPSEIPRQEQCANDGNGSGGRQQDFGLVVDRMPSEQDLTLTPRARSSAKTLPSSSLYELSLSGNEETVVEKEVDHVPAGITDVATKNDDSTASVDGDTAGDKSKDESKAELFVVKEPKEIDHVPDDVSNVSTENDDSTASVEGDEVPEVEQADETADEAEFGPVVDRMPSLLSVSQPHDRTVSTIAPSSANDDEPDENEKGGETDESTSAHAVASGKRSPPGVVDHVPSGSLRSSKRSTMLAAATEMSVASELSNTLGDEALESDIDAREENYGPVVDHTPLQQSVHSRRNPSVRVQAPIEEIDEETDDEEQYFGPVVDHTPTVQATTVSSVTGSMAVAAPPSEVDEDSDDDSDDQSDGDGDQEGQMSDFCDDDTLDAPTASLVSASRYGPALVDHVPNRPGTRPTDASTLVVVDPFEVSTVGDMTYEEQQYGPVVDHLPSAHPPPQASTTGSTVAAATASVGQDDTLVDDDDEGRPRNENESEGDDGATLPTLDNPPPMETNVVDHVPEQGPPEFRIDSVLTTAPTQSVLSPDETRDSEFGLVVDHLPSNHLPSPPSRGSMAVLASESVFDADTESGFVEEEASTPTGEQPASERTMEEAKVVVDLLPPARENRSMRAADSTVTVRSHVSDDDTLEAIARPDRYGPVVDQLPPPVQRSLGGSTTAALATLSEVNDDTFVDDDVPGWDDDEQELDSIQGTDSRQSRPRPASRGLSVTFSHETVRAVHGLDEDQQGNNSLFTSIADETQYFDAESGDTTAKSENETQETQYFDPESGESIDEGNREIASTHINGSARAPSTVHCTRCDDATGAECPCVQRILQSGSNEEGMVLSVRTPEGVAVDIDVKKLLEDETTKRLLLEKEVEALKSTVGSLETVVSLNETESADGKRATEDVCESMDSMTRELDSVKGERDTLERQNEDLSTQLAASQSEIAGHERAAEDWAARESGLLAEIEELRRTRDESRSESQQLAAMSNELVAEVDQMRNTNEELLLELDKRKGHCDALEAENKGLVDECAAKERMLSEVAQERAVLSSRQSALEDETIQLRRALEESSQAATSESDLRNQLSALQVEAATKSGECEELRAQLDQVQKKLQESEGRGFAQMKESTRVKRVHDAEVQRLQEQIQSAEEAKQTMVDEYEAATLQINKKVSSMDSQVQSLMSENESLRMTISDNQNKHDAQIRQERSSLQSQTSQLRALESKLRLLDAEKARTSEEVSSLKTQLNDATEQLNAATALQGEYDSLQETLAVNKETIQSLQEQVEALSQANKTGTDQMETLVDSISNERDVLRATLQSRESELQAAQSELEARSNEKASLEDRLEALAAKCGEMEATVEDLQSNAVKQELELAEKDRLCQSLRESQDEARATLQIREEYEQEVRNLNQALAERDQAMQSLQLELETHVNVIRDRDDTISQLEQQRAEAERQIEAITQGRDETLSRFQELEAELVHAKQQQRALEDSFSQPSARERELEESLQALAGERDAAVQEREMLEEDSEELLVQLGLMKEQVDAHEGEVEELQQIIAEKEIAIKHAEERLHEAEGYINELSRAEEEPLEQNGDSDAGKLSELQQIVDELTLAKEDLQQQVDDLSSTNAYIDAQVTSLRDEKVELLGRMQEMEQRQLASAADAAEREQQFESRVGELEEQCRHLDEVCRLKDEELERTKARLHEAQASSAASQADVGVLQQQVTQLESACSEQGNVLHDRDRAFEDMRMELEGLRSRAVEPSAHSQPNVDLDSLHNRLHHAERSVQHYQERLREMEAVLEQARKELKHKTEKLSETESVLFDKELELDLLQQDKSKLGELQKQLHEMESLLTQRNHEIQEAFERERSMEKTLAEFRASVTAPKDVPFLSENGGPSSNAVEEARQLRAQLSSLRQQLQSSDSGQNEREEKARQEVLALNETIASKREQIASLEAQLQSLSTEFSSSQDQLVSKEADYRRLSLELEETRVGQLQSTRTVTSQVLESSSREEAESVENMRLHIISLAQALEQSETQRADAIERLLNERKASADSLRRLGESVKRFYSSLSYRDG